MIWGGGAEEIEQKSKTEELVRTGPEVVRLGYNQRKVWAGVWNVYRGEKSGM